MSVSYRDIPSLFCFLLCRHVERRNRCLTQLPGPKTVKWLGNLVGLSLLALFGLFGQEGGGLLGDDQYHHPQSTFL